MDKKQQQCDADEASAARDPNQNSATEASPTVAASSHVVTRMEGAAHAEQKSQSATANLDLPIPLGSIVKHRFVLDQVLGRGGMGCVYRALDLRKKEARDADPYIAIKVLSGAISKHPDAFIALQRETRKTQTLAHPNIVTVYDFDRDGHTVFMTMEALQGVSLDKYIKSFVGDKNPATAKKIDRKKALGIIRGIAVALAYAHSRGFVHSDLKPSNIILTDSDRVKVLDLGIARAMTQDQHGDAFETGKLHALTPRYASAEMFRQLPADPRDDIYALGLIACQLLGGPHAYLNATAIEAELTGAAPLLPKSNGIFLRRLLRDSVQLRASGRPANGSEFLRRLDFALKGYKTLAAAALLLVAVAVGNGVYWSVFSTSAPNLGDLPIETQQEFKRAISEADNALAAGALDGALYYLDAAYAIQKTDSEVDRLRTSIVSILKQRAARADGSLDQQLLRDAVQTLQQYPVFAAPTELQKITESL